MRLFLYANCTSCKKAEALLKEHGVAYERPDYFKDRFSRDELAAVLADAGVSPREILSTRSRAYKELGLDGREAPEDELLDLMVQQPTLLRRPLLIGRGGSTIGFDRKRFEELIAAERAAT